MKKTSLKWYSILIPDIIEAIQERNLEEIKNFLKELAPSEIVEITDDLPPAEQALVFRLLDKEKAADCLAEMSKDEAEELIKNLTSKEVKEILSTMDPDDRVRIFDELPSDIVEKLISNLDREKREEIRILLNYPYGSAGHRMNPFFARISGDKKVKEALDEIRKKSFDEEIIREIYVTDEKNKLLGKVKLPKLVLSNPEKKVYEVMEKNPIAVNVLTDQEEAANIIKNHDLISLPVVDSENRVLGILTVDDIIDIIEEEATEDIHKLGGLTSPEPEEEYYQLNLWERVKKRVPWLISLLIFELITATVIKSFDKLIQSAVFLSYFIPMLIGTGGNTGTQSVTLAVRAMALGEIEFSDLLKIVLKEVLTGAGMGLILGIVGGGVAFIITHSLRVTQVIFFALLTVILFSNLLGIFLPMIFKRLKIDPAISSSPLITTLIDVGGLFIYFMIAYVFVF